MSGVLGGLSELRRKPYSWVCSTEKLLTADRNHGAASCRYESSSDQSHRPDPNFSLVIESSLTFVQPSVDLKLPATIPISDGHNLNGERTRPQRLGAVDSRQREMMIISTALSFARPDVAFSAASIASPDSSGFSSGDRQFSANRCRNCLRRDYALIALRGESLLRSR